MNVKIDQLIKKLAKLSITHKVEVLPDSTHELTLTFANSRAVLVHVPEVGEVSYYDVDVIFRTKIASYIYIASEVPSDSLETEFQDIYAIISSFKHGKYTLETEQFWRFWHRNYLIFNLNGRKLGALQTK